MTKPKVMEVLEINLNQQLANLLKHHGVNVDLDEEFINTDLHDNLKFKARSVYEEVNSAINSRLDVMVLTSKGEQIVDCCDDYGKTIEEAVNNNLRNFSSGTLHPLLTAFGCKDKHTHDQVTIEDWEIGGVTWKAYIGNLTPKSIGDGHSIIPPAEFFDSFELGIKGQKLTKRFHYFRAYYSQLEKEITYREFLMDNEPIAENTDIFNSLPILPEFQFYSCRNFIIMKNNAIN